MMLLLYYMHIADPTHDQLRGNIINDQESPPRERYKFTLFSLGNEIIATVLRYNTFNTKLHQALSKRSLQPHHPPCLLPTPTPPTMARPVVAPRTPAK